MDASDDGAGAAPPLREGDRVRLPDVGWDGTDGDPAGYEFVDDMRPNLGRTGEVRRVLAGGRWAEVAVGDGAFRDTAYWPTARLAPAGRAAEGESRAVRPPPNTPLREGDWVRLPDGGWEGTDGDPYGSEFSPELSSVLGRVGRVKSVLRNSINKPGNVILWAWVVAADADGRTVDGNWPARLLDPVAPPDWFARLRDGAWVRLPDQPPAPEVLAGGPPAFSGPVVLMAMAGQVGRVRDCEGGLDGLGWPLVVSPVGSGRWPAWLLEPADPPAGFVDLREGDWVRLPAEADGQWATESHAAECGRLGQVCGPVCHTPDGWAYMVECDDRRRHLWPSAALAGWVPPAGADEGSEIGFGTPVRLPAELPPPELRGGDPAGWAADWLTPLLGTTGWVVSGPTPPPGLLWVRPAGRPDGGVDLAWPAASLARTGDPEPVEDPDGPLTDPLVRAAVAAGWRPDRLPARAWADGPLPLGPAEVEAELAALAARWPDAEAGSWDGFQAVRFTSQDVTLTDEDYGDTRLGRFEVSVPAEPELYGELVFARPLDQDGDDEYPHPHVSRSGNSVCMGTADRGLEAAVAEGRLLDAAELVCLVLDSYDPESAYRRLSTWHTETCGSCGNESEPDEVGSCGRCDDPLCGECRTAECKNCDGVFHAGCVDPCAGCGGNVCGGCAHDDGGSVYCDDSSCWDECADCSHRGPAVEFDEDGRCDECRVDEDEEDDEDEDEEEGDEETEAAAAASAPALPIGTRVRTPAVPIVSDWWVPDMSAQLDRVGVVVGSHPYSPSVFQVEMVSNEAAGDTISWYWPADSLTVLTEPGHTSAAALAAAQPLEIA